MEINVRHDSKMVDVWLTNEEKKNDGLRDALRPIYKEYKAKRYLVSVFQSGERDLTDATSDLICYNRKRMAQIQATSTAF